MIIADEPTTALDVTIQAQILELLKDICNRLGVAIIMITHNLGVVAAYADKVNVMYAARIVEQGGANQRFLVSHPIHIQSDYFVLYPEWIKKRRQISNHRRLTTQPYGTTKWVSF